MAKHLFLNTLKWVPGFNVEHYNEIWKPKYDELAKKHKMVLKYMDTPFGSDTEVDGYRDFRMAIANIEGGDVFSANTMILTLL